LSPSQTILQEFSMQEEMEDDNTAYSLI